MASTIGVRIYMVTVRRDRAVENLSFSSLFASNSTSFIMSFPGSYSSVTSDSNLKRSWYFEQKETVNPASNRGLLHYGTYGFESKLIDYRTKKKNYDRKVTDIEEIPLYYEFWHPHKADHVLMAFQSFQGRSCIQMVQSQMQLDFSKRNAGYNLHFRKLIPTDDFHGYRDAPVKNLRFIRRNAPSDIAEKYLGKAPGAPIDFQVIIGAKRKGSLGILGDLKDRMLRPKEAGIVVDGSHFQEAIAEVRIGGKVRHVGMLAPNGDYGVIDITNAVQPGPNGHPTFESVKQECKDLLKEFQESIEESQL